MTQYVVLLPGDESAWESATAEEQAAVYSQHEKFSQVLAERGHKVTGGAELTHSSTAKTLRSDGRAITVTDGPYAETVEQLSGFYVVESDDLDDLLEVTKILATDAHGNVGMGSIEVRACTNGSDAAS